MNTTKPKHLVFVVNQLGFFISHRLVIAKAAIAQGYRVSIIAPHSENPSHHETISNAGITVITVNMTRSGMNPLSELKIIYALFRQYQAIKPDIAHHVTIKPCLYGGIAARLAGVPNVVTAISGLGHVFMSQSLNSQVIKWLVTQLYKVALGKPRPISTTAGSRNHVIIFQNDEDLNTFKKMGLATDENTVMIRGSGVDTDSFVSTPEPTLEPSSPEPIVVLAARLLKDKGIEEYIEAIRILRSKKISAKFLLVGPIDMGNPTGISKNTLDGWEQEGLVEWLGERNDINQLFSNAHIVCLPSYREGVPKVLLEAAACGRPIVTTNVPGCRDVVIHGYNGLVVTVKNAVALADALETLITNPSLRKEYGKNGREMAVKQFSVKDVVSKTLAIYNAF